MNTTLMMLESSGKVINFSEWTFADRVAEALKVSLLGLATVFAALAIIWGILEVFKVFVYDIPNKRKAEQDKKGNGDKPAEITSSDVDVVDDDSEIVAAISAAIALVTERPVSSFRVVSFRKTGTK